METLLIVSIILSALSLIGAALVVYLVKKGSVSSSGDGLEASEARLKEDIRVLKETVAATVSTQTDTLNKSFGTFADALDKSQQRTNEGVQKQSEQVLERVKAQSDNNEKRIGEMKEELRLSLGEMKNEMKAALDKLREDNNAQLDRMRGTVDEKLTKTLNERLESSFKNVSDSLDKLYKDLGELKSLDNAVSDLNKTLSGVKTRGNWGELSLDGLLSDILTDDQYEKQSNMGRRTKEMVDFGRWSISPSYCPVPRKAGRYIFPSTPNSPSRTSSA